MPSSHAEAGAPPFLGTSNDPQVSVALDLHDPLSHPRQLVYDAKRDGLWFWTSTQDKGVSFDNRVYFYDLASRTARSWPIYSGDWSSQLLAGLALAPDGAIWIGWNHNLVEFHPSDGSYSHFSLPDQPGNPLPKAVIGDLPGDLGISDLAVAPDGTVWIARYAAVSLTAFTPATQSFQEHALPSTAGDPSKLAIGPDGHIFFTIDLSADHPGYAFERVGEYDPLAGVTSVYPQAAHSLAVTSSGDLYTAMDGHAYGLARLSAGERASARSQSRVPAFSRGLAPFDIGGAALAVDLHGRVWMAVSGKPVMATLDPSSGQTRQFQYSAPSVAAHPRHQMPGPQAATPAPGAVWLSPIAAMTTDGRGHLWYIRAGWSQIEEVAA